MTALARLVLEMDNAKISSTITNANVMLDSKEEIVKLVRYN